MSNARTVERPTRDHPALRALLRCARLPQRPLADLPPAPAARAMRDESLYKAKTAGRHWAVLFDGGAADANIRQEADRD